MKDWTEGDVQVAGCRIHYYRTGGEKPPFLMAHGMTENGLCWSPLANILSAQYDIIMYDAQGHGLSGRFDVTDPRQNSLAHLVGLITALEIQQSLFIGHSIGARTVAQLAAQYPHLAKAIILEDPPWRSLQPAMSPRISEAGRKRMMLHERGIAMLQRKSMGDLIDHCRRFNPTWSDIDIRNWAESKIQLDPLFFSAAPAPSRFTWYKEIIEEIRCPVLLISGDPELGGIVTTEVGKQICQLWNAQDKSQWVRIEGAGHNIRREQFRDYCRIIDAFLGEIEKK